MDPGVLRGEVARTGLYLPHQPSTVGEHSGNGLQASWCNGAAGFVHLWTLAHRLLGKQHYARMATGAAWAAFEAPQSNGDLCCGLAGRAYGLLNLYKHSGERVWLDRARDLAECAAVVSRASSQRRDGLYQRCRRALSSPVRVFWDAHPGEIARGVGGAGKFENYFAVFRRFVLPLVHSRARVTQLLRGGSPEVRNRFYRERWNSLRWRLLFRVFFSRFMMGRLGRDPSFFRYVEGSVAARIFARAQHALTELDPADNPYLQWILTGQHQTALPFALRAENFDKIRHHLDRLEWWRMPLEDFLAEAGPRAIDHFNLSDIFEYMSLENYHALLARLVAAGRPGGRLAYWNMLAPRSRPESMAGELRPLDDLAARLHGEDKAFFYSRFVVEEIRA